MGSNSEACSPSKAGAVHHYPHHCVLKGAPGLVSGCTRTLMIFFHVIVNIAIDYRAQNRLFARKVSALTQMSCPVMEVDNPIRKLDLCELERFS